MSPVCEDDIYRILENTDTQVTFQDGGYCRCDFNLLDEEGNLNLLDIQHFINFCAERNVLIRSKRNGSVLPASFGAVFSDMKRSKAFRQALHIANHPKDRSQL